MQHRVLLAAPLDQLSEARLAAAAEIVRPAGRLEADLIAAVPGCDALIGRTHTPITRAVLRAGAPRLRVVGVAGVGTDRVDVQAAAELGIQVVSTPGAASDAVAEFTIALMLELLRPIRRLAAAYAAGEFEDARRPAHGDELRNMVVGVVGMGRIGSRVARMCSAGFGARVLYSDILPVGPFSFTAESVDLDQIWTACDIITLHTPLTDGTRRLVNEATLRHLQPTTHLINTSRGEIVDTPALVSALESHRLAGAALDVTDPEPLPAGHALFSVPNCVLTPHVAARTFTGLRNMCAVVDQVITALTYKDPPHLPHRVHCKT